jgi:hypothetical protein
MKRKKNWKLTLMAGVGLAVPLLLGVPIYAQQTPHQDAPPGMEEGGSPFSDTSHVQTTFGGRHAAAETPAVSTFPGEVKGVTRYPSGLPMPGVAVNLLNGDADVDRTIVSESDGSFEFKNLRPGEYQLTARKEGFAPSPITKVQLATGKIVTADVPLGPSMAASPMNPNSAGLMRTSRAPGYRVQPASLRLAATDEAADDTVRTSETAPSATSQPSANSSEQPDVSVLLDEVRALSKRVEELEAERKNAGLADQPAGADPAAAAAAPQDAAAAQAPATPKPGPGQYLSTAGTITYYKGDVDMATHPDSWTPFAYADWTWMNASGRQDDSPWSTKYFTPEFRADANYIDDFNHPRDDTMGGSTESFRVNEWQLEQVSLGGDIRIGHARGRILTMFGLFSTTTPRNDGSLSKGQWSLANAYRYISEGWGGYSFDGVGHGLNIDAGIFVSYIGLFSYYNFDNWAYQPSFVSSNTPWFFNGLRIQYYPTAKLKIEPWIVNGWQSYARYNSKPGLGGQILWRPKPYFSAVFNNYGMGTDVLGSPGTSRIHTDDSFELRELNHPDAFLDMIAGSLTLDAGCQYGGGQNCFNDKNSGFKTDMLGYMIYERFQFKHDLYGVTLGGGYLNNPGRYLTLLPPINGATAVTGTPYFTENPGDKYHAYDFTATFDYMPSQWLTFRGEMGYRHSDVPYWSGRGGITPPGTQGNTSNPQEYVCTNGSSSVNLATGPFSSPSAGGLSNNPSASGLPTDNIAAVSASCASQVGPGFSLWQPDLRKSQIAATIAIMTRF